MLIHNSNRNILNELMCNLGTVDDDSFAMDVAMYIVAALTYWNPFDQTHAFMRDVSSLNAQLEFKITCSNWDSQ